LLRVAIDVDVPGRDGGLKRIQRRGGSAREGSSDYDDAGNVVRMVGGRGKEYLYEYDGLNRRERAEDPVGTYTECRGPASF